MTKKPEGDTNRRDFLKLAGTAAPAAVAVVAAGGTAAEAAPADPTSDRMQDTAHTRAYLDSTRF
ncbi:twin-arginine translocation pathway signal protein [Roseobacter ponti]|uniref:Twin-arginine translocation pathway signal protein n=1 Tax=Roseobacter ponti TaxID=1891787 RepID=A0A858SSV7_9RHOB|nr:twin-arginine translocation pathway signal protein [Roseobacter ponti]QJF51755.1 twin-arginine translocation pathway signal protein [Roseobacter ponti]